MGTKTLLVKFNLYLEIGNLSEHGDELKSNCYTGAQVWKKKDKFIHIEW